MKRLNSLLEAHPHPVHTSRQAALDCILACAECDAACTVCADASLAEPDLQALVLSVRLNLDCADVCHVTYRLITRPSHRDAPALRAQLQACIAICRACADECDKHSEHEHCRICAEVCRDCIAACERMANAIVA